MDKPKKLATQTMKNKAKPQHNMSWTPLCANKRKKDMSAPTNNKR